MNEKELFFKEHFKEIKQLADNNNKITLACKYLMLKEELKKKDKEIEDLRQYNKELYVENNGSGKQFFRNEAIRLNKELQEAQEDLKKKVEELDFSDDMVALMWHPEDIPTPQEINNKIKERIYTIFGNEGDNHSEEKRLSINRAKVPHAKDVFTELWDNPEDDRWDKEKEKKENDN